VKKRGIGNLIINRKGQVTIFIIIGVLVLLISATFFYVRYTRVREAIPVIPVLEDIPEQAQPVSIYVQTCLSFLAEEGLRKLGTQGGYIDLEEAGITTSSLNPTEADGIQFSPDSDLKIPYWWYMDSPNDCKGCTFSGELVPDEESIESQIDEYIIDNIDMCLQDFEPFKEQGYDINIEGSPKPFTVIGETDVSVFLEYPLEVSTQESKTDISQFYASLPLNFRDIYDLASEIKTSQQNDDFLEQQFLNLLADYQGLDKDSLPPKADFDFELGGGTIWTVPEVQSNIESMLMAYIPGLQVPHSLNYERVEFPGEPIREATYAMEIPVNYNREYSDLEVTFDYLGWWPIYFNTGQGGIIQPESITGALFPIGLQRYNTAYDISFPSVVTITDPDAFDGRGYSFMFALEANIRNSQIIDQGFEGFEGVYLFQESLLCNLNQRNTGDITIEVTDISSGRAVKDIDISYICGPETCYIGKTGINGILKERFPVCFNGIVVFNNRDYFIPAVALSTKEDKEVVMDIDAYPFVERTISIEKKNLGTGILSNPLSLGANEQAILTLSRVQENPGDADVVAAADITGTEEAVIRLVPGKYEARIDMFLPDQTKVLRLDSCHQMLLKGSYIRLP
jgi:hypothetical protein